MTKTVLIKKGNHMASNQFTGFRVNVFGSPTYAAIVEFDESFKYTTDSPDNQKDWNKLLGVSWGFYPLIKQFQMHENSSRFGVRYNPETDCIEIAPYYYLNGSKFYAENSGLKIISLPFIKQTKKFQSVLLSIVPSKEHNIVHYAWTTVWEEHRGIVTLINPRIQSVKQPVPSVNGFTAPMYFGGQETAKQDIRVKIKIVKNVEARFT